MNKSLVALTSAGLIAFASIASADKKQQTQEIEHLKPAGTFLTSRIDANTDGEASSRTRIRFAISAKTRVVTLNSQLRGDTTNIVRPGRVCAEFA